MTIPTRKQKKGSKYRAQAPGAKLHNDTLHAAAQERRAQALQLRLRGMSIVRIAKQLGVSDTAASEYVKKALAAIPYESSKEAIAVAIASREEQKLGEYQRAAQIEQRLREDGHSVNEYARLQSALTGVKALILDIDQDLAKLRGQYAPQQHTVAFERVNPATVREMSDEDLQRIASGDFSALNGAGGGGSDRDRGAGDSTPSGTA